jgi:hypothetical protein
MARRYNDCERDATETWSGSLAGRHTFRPSGPIRRATSSDSRPIPTPPTTGVCNSGLYSQERGCRMDWVRGGWVGLRQLYCVVKLPHPSCRRGATPGPDGALDARQGMGLPPGPIGRVEILVGTACGARPSSSPSPPVDDAYATRLGFDHRLPGRVSSDSDLTTGSRAGTVSLAWQHGGRDGGGEGGAGARRLRRRRRRAEDGARITIPGLGPEGRVS